MRFLWTSLGALVALAALTAPAGADEDDRSLSVVAGYGLYNIPEHTPSGGVLGIDYERGFSDSMLVRVSGIGGYYPLGNTLEDGTEVDSSFSAQATVGLTYLLDVLKYVPWASIGVGGIALIGGPGDGKINGLVEFAVGLDILHSREWSYGVTVRFDSFAQETTVFTAGARATYRWGFF